MTPADAHAKIPLVMDKLEVPDLPPKRRAELVDLWQQLRGLAGLAITPESVALWLTYYPPSMNWPPKHYTEQWPVGVRGVWPWSGKPAPPPTVLAPGRNP
jgi:hypothetical protein